ncbi:MAG: hypothetical protein KAQ71_19840 [Desulfobulbaceae bacterium]|nr:hypothetical protein [Desulfobulbaceae bacterium]
MNTKKVFYLMLAVFTVFCLVFSWSTSLWAHGEGTQIVPESLSVKAGSKLTVTVNGLVGTKTASFNLTGMTGKFELGEFPINSDDFTQILQIPADVPPGTYRLTVDGGEKSAKVVISIN